jgi:hypothetical protein
VIGVAPFDARQHGVDLFAQSLQRSLLHEAGAPLHAFGDLFGEPFCLPHEPSNVRCLGVIEVGASDGTRSLKNSAPLAVNVLPSAPPKGYR